MRVIEQARLWFREGASDKVYEVDLVEVATNQYMVNFRFGRRGSALTDGTKTAMPLPLDKARAVFAKLVAEKTAAGYRPLGSPGAGQPSTPAPSAPSPRPPPPPPPPPTDALLRILRDGPGSSPEIGRAIWRATDLDLTAAEPHLLALLDKPGPRYLKHPSIWPYLLASALARCGTQRSVPRLEQLAQDPRSEPHVKDIARLAIARLAPDRAGALVRSLLPAGLVATLERGSAHELATAAEKLVGANPAGARNAIVGLYLANTAVTRPAILAVARVARLDNPEAAIVRVLFRLAEVNRDGELYVRIARRIEAHTGGRPRWDGRQYRSGPFGENTRRYFRRRAARVLRRLGRAASPDYAAMAAAWLLAYTDEDAGSSFQGAISNDWYDRFAKHHTLNDILYGKSPRYQRAAYGRSAWKCKRGYRPGGATPNQREERFPLLWDAAPDQLWRLVGLGKATPVVELATKALRANRAYVDRLGDDVIARVLGLGHPLAQRFVFEMIQARPMSTMLARGALMSTLLDAHAWVLRWVEGNPDAAAADSDLIALLATGKTAQIRDGAMTLLRARPLAPAVARAAAMRSLAILLSLDGEDGSEEDRAAGAANVILYALAEPLREIPATVLRDLIAHPLSAIGALAGELMMRHAQRDALPADLLESLLASPHAAVRAAGARILATMPPEIAKDDPQAIVLFATSANAELREHTRTLVGAIAREFPDVGRVIADRLIDALLARQPEGAPAHIVSLLRAELAGVLPVKAPALIMKLIAAFSPHAREAGGLLLGQLGPDDLGLDDIARLAQHEILAVRQGAQRLARAAVDRYRLAPVAVSRLVDSPWEDTRLFAMQLIEAELTPLSADAIIAICDSIRPEVQALGKQLLFAQLTDADAGRYLVRLAEHPSTSLQLLVSGLLELHVPAGRNESDPLHSGGGGDLARLEALVPFLTTVLSQVNRGRIAKERVIVLLRREAARSEAAARVLAPLLERQSATIAITQKHPLIATMVDVHHIYPEIALPIAIVEPQSAAKGGR